MVLIYPCWYYPLEVFFIPDSFSPASYMSRVSIHKTDFSVDSCCLRPKFMPFSGQLLPLVTLSAVREFIHLASESLPLFVEPLRECFKEEEVDWVRLMSANAVTLPGRSHEARTGMTGLLEALTHSKHKTLGREHSHRRLICGSTVN